MCGKSCAQFFITSTTIRFISSSYTLSASNTKFMNRSFIWDFISLFASLPKERPFFWHPLLIPNLLKNLKGKENTIRLLTNRITTEFLLRELNFASFLHHRMKRTTYSVIIYAQILPKCVELPGNQRTFRGGNGVLGCQHSCRHFTRKTFNTNATKLVRILLLGMRLFVVKRIATAIDICAPPVLVRRSRWCRVITATQSIIAHHDASKVTGLSTNFLANDFFRLLWIVNVFPRQISFLQSNVKCLLI